METSICVLALLLARALSVWSMPVEPRLEPTDIASLDLLSETISAMLATMARLSKESQVEEDGHLVRSPRHEDIEVILSENSNDETQESFLASRINSEQSLNDALSEDQNNEPLQTENENQDESNINPSEPDDTIKVSSDSENNLEDELQQIADETLNKELQEQAPEVPSDIQEIIADKPSEISETPAETDPEASEPNDSKSVPEAKVNILRQILSGLIRFTESNTGGAAELASLQEKLDALSNEMSSPNIEENNEIEESTNIEDQESTNLVPAENDSELEDSLKTLTDIPEEVVSIVEELLEMSDGTNIVTNNEVPETVENETPSEAIEAEPELLEVNPNSVDDESDNKEVESSQFVESDSSFSDSPSDLSSVNQNLESNAEEVLNIPAEVNDAPLELSETEKMETDLDNQNQVVSGINENYPAEHKMDRFLYLLKSNANTLKRNIISSSGQRIKAEKSLLDLLSMIAYGASFLA